MELVIGSRVIEFEVDENKDLAIRVKDLSNKTTSLDWLDKDQVKVLIEDLQDFLIEM